jgi:uncharacterized protein YndB with AHSA1/START domain
MNPPSASGTIVKEITIKASAERIFEALTDPRQRSGPMRVSHSISPGRRSRTPRWAIRP